MTDQPGDTAADAATPADRAGVRSPLGDSIRQSDPERGLTLLWRGLDPATRGPKAKLTLDQLAAAGVVVADSHGLEAVSIRRVAAELGVGPMSLYTYVPSKVELLELMIDRVFGEIALAADDLGWRVRLEFLAGERWRMFRRHPWVLQSNLSRIPLGPNVLDAVEDMYSAFDNSTLPALQVVSLVGAIEEYLQGAARSVAVEDQEASMTGVSYEEYWGARASFWEKYFDAERYPMHLKLWERGGFDAQALGYEFGLARILDGIEVLIAAGSR
jgi:AcrR family transcriptional regulator